MIAASSTGQFLRVKNAPLFGRADNFVVLAGSGITNTKQNGDHPVILARFQLIQRREEL